MATSNSAGDIRQQLGDRYAIERELGRGGMGAVYLVRADRIAAMEARIAALEKWRARSE